MDLSAHRHSTHVYRRRRSAIIAHKLLSLTLYPLYLSLSDLHFIIIANEETCNTCDRLFAQSTRNSRAIYDGASKKSLNKRRLDERASKQDRVHNFSVSYLCVCSPSKVNAFTLCTDNSLCAVLLLLFYCTRIQLISQLKVYWQVQVHCK